MSKDIKQQNQMNLWGKQVDGNASLALEPQRADLFMVDLEQAALQIAHVADERMPPMYPQFVRSITFPDVHLRAEPFRRDSVPYNMPSWDDPIEAVRITFLVDTYDDSNRSSVCDLLDTWMALSRAGRGARNGGYQTANNVGYFTLDAAFKVACRFDINVSLLRGTMPSQQAVDDAQAINALNARLSSQFSAQRGTNPQLPPPPVEPQLVLPDMKEHTKWVLRKAWCAGYKLTDLSYTDTQLMMVEAAFYPEAVERETIGVLITGSPVAIIGNPVKTTVQPPAVSGTPIAPAGSTGTRINRGGQQFQGTLGTG